jgi:uncharacterized membrane protein
MEIREHKRIALDRLSGNWTSAVIVTFVAALLGGVSSSGPEFNINLNESGTNASVSIGNIDLGTLDPASSAALSGILTGVIIVVLVLAVVFIFLGSVVQLGYCRFNLDLIDRQREPELNTLFSYFTHWRTAVAAGLLQTLYILAWSLLFIIPGIIAGYSYAMTGYILAENPYMAASDAIRYSKDMMYGNRWRLFCLEISFIGWDLLNIFTLGIGTLWLRPYKQAAITAFYREVSGTEHREIPVGTEQI